MTDRLRGVVVTFDQDMREDDAEHLITAIRLLKHVLSVEPVGQPDEVHRHMSEARVRRELGDKIMKIIYPERA